MSLPNTYIPNVPQGNQQINNTQQPIEGNFQDIYDLLAINHIPFNTTDTFGRHTLVEYVNQSTDPATTSTEMALYSKVVTNDPNGSELFYRYPSSGNVVQLTGVSSTSTGGSGLTSGGYFYAPESIAFGAVAGYWQYLSNGILFMSYAVNNYISSPTTSPYVFTFPSGTFANGVVVPTFTQTPFNIQITGQFEGQNGTNVNFAATATSNTQGLIYYQGQIITGSTIASVQVTLIGI